MNKFTNRQPEYELPLTPYEVHMNERYGVYGKYAMFLKGGSSGSGGSSEDYDTFDYYGLTGYGSYSLNPTLTNLHIYYIDQVNGLDTNDGSSTSLAWKTLSHARTVAVSGDTVYLMSGNYGVFSESSATGRTDWITYKAYTGQTPIFTGIDIEYNSLTNCYLRFDGITITPTGVATSFILGINLDYANYFDFRNCIIHDARTGTTFAYKLYGVQYGVRIQHSQNVIGYHNDISFVMTAILAATTINSTFAFNHIHTLGAGTGFYYGSSGTSNNIIFEYNNVHDSVTDTTDTELPTDPHASAISLRNDGIIIRGNTFRNIGTSSCFMFYTDTGKTSFSNIVIENNLLSDIPQANIIRLFLAGENIMIRNNTVIGYRRTDSGKTTGPYSLCAGIVFESLASGYDGSGIHIHNNVFASAIMSLPATVDIHNNIIWSYTLSTAPNTFVATLADNYICTNSADPITYFTSGFFTGLTSVTQLVETYPAYTLSPIIDYSLATGSPAINYGDDTLQPNLSHGSVDANGFILANGVSRNATHHSDGAYEV